jgi:hypothetical protein
VCLNGPAFTLTGVLFAVIVRMKLRDLMLECRP